MSIVLIRHGKPKIDFNAWFSPREFGGWIQEYNTAPILNDISNRKIQQLIDGSDYVVCSSLARSSDSARILGYEHIDEIGTQFREMELPHASLSFPRLPVRFWLVFFRLAWLLGYQAGAESFSAAKHRAKLAANILDERAQNNKRVVFVGHRLFNKFVERSLIDKGYLLKRSTGKAYWRCRVLSKRSF